MVEKELGERNFGFGIRTGQNNDMDPKSTDSCLVLKISFALLLLVTPVALSVEMGPAPPIVPGHEMPQQINRFSHRHVYSLGQLPLDKQKRRLRKCENVCVNNRNPTRTTSS